MIHQVFLHSRHKNFLFYAQCCNVGMRLCKCWIAERIFCPFRINPSDNCYSGGPEVDHQIHKKISFVQGIVCKKLNTLGAIVFEPISYYSASNALPYLAMLIGSRVWNHLLPSQPQNSVNMFTTSSHKLHSHLVNWLD